MVESSVDVKINFEFGVKRTFELYAKYDRSEDIDKSQPLVQERSSAIKDVHGRVVFVGESFQTLSGRGIPYSTAHHGSLKESARIRAQS